MKRSEEAYSDQGAVWDAIASKSSRVVQNRLLEQ